MFMGGDTVQNICVWCLEKRAGVCFSYGMFVLGPLERLNIVGLTQSRWDGDGAGSELLFSVK